MDLIPSPSTNQQEALKIGSIPWLVSNIGLHGREDELEILNEAYERTVVRKDNGTAREDKPSPELVLISGLPGVGKTHLVKHSFMIAEQHARSDKQGNNDLFFRTSSHWLLNFACQVPDGATNKSLPIQQLARQ